MTNSSLPTSPTVAVRWSHGGPELFAARAANMRGDTVMRADRRLVNPPSSSWTRLIEMLTCRGRGVNSTRPRERQAGLVPCVAAVFTVTPPATTLARQRVATQVVSCSRRRP